MRVPRLRLRGPLDQRDATPLLMVAAAMIAIRLPMSFMALVALPLVVIVVQGWRRRAPWPRLLMSLFGWCLVASLVSLVLFHPDQLASTGSNFAIMIAITAVAAAVFATGRTLRAADRLVDGLYLGLLVVWGLSIIEAVTGFKFMSVLYPQANTLAALKANRFYVAALFPNYNDYSVAMALLCTLVAARMVFAPRVHVFWQLGRWVVMGTAAFFIVVMGSRGALVGLLLGVLLVVLISIRTLHPRVFGVRVVSLGVLVAAGLAVAVMSSPWFQDNSTANRFVILGNIGHMWAADPVSAMLGYGSMTAYSQAAASAFGRRLMDPHNVLAEIALWYGLPALVGYVALWLVIMRRALVGQAFAANWRSVGVLAIVTMMPVLGIVSASTLRYHLFWLWLIAMVAYLRVGVTRPGSGPRSSRSPQPHAG